MLVAHLTSSSQVRQCPENYFFKAGNVKDAGCHIHTTGDCLFRCPSLDASSKCSVAGTVGHCHGGESYHG